MTPPNLFNLVEKDADKRFPLTVIKKEKMTHDTYTFELGFPNEEWISGLFAGGHFIFHAEVNGEMMSRKYTPISSVNQKGKAVFAIKIYRENPDYPGGGLFTQHLERAVGVGDSILVEGPIGKTNYQGWGDFINFGKPLKHKKMRIGLLAGGSGLTPMYSIALASSLARDGAEITFLFSNKTKDDILCKTELEMLSSSNPDLTLFHTLTEHDPAKHGHWEGLTGLVCYEMFKECGFPAPADDVLILCCGPPGFNQCIITFLKANGYQYGEHFV